jgi:hypothetical protein
LYYEPAAASELPAHVRAASAVRRFAKRIVIVQDDVNALAVRDARGAVRPLLLPAHASGRRVFDDTFGNKRDKLDLEACVALAPDRLVAFGSGSTPVRERLVVWNGQEPPMVVVADAFYAELHAAATPGARLNIEGAVVSGPYLRLFQRGNDSREASMNAIVDVDRDEFAAWLDGRAASPRVARVATVDIGAVRNVPFGFTDAVALDDRCVAILACAEDSASAISDGAVLGCRVGLLDGESLTTVDVCDASGERTLLKIEGIEGRPGSDHEFDVVVDVDRPAAPARLGRLAWKWR